MQPCYSAFHCCNNPQHRLLSFRLACSSPLYKALRLIILKDQLTQPDSTQQLSVAATGLKPEAVRRSILFSLQPGRRTALQALSQYLPPTICNSSLALPLPNTFPLSPAQTPPDLPVVSDGTHLSHRTTASTPTFVLNTRSWRGQVIYLLSPGRP